jgi:hypothetical protein
MIHSPPSVIIIIRRSKVGRSVRPIATNDNGNADILVALLRRTPIIHPTLLINDKNRLGQKKKTNSSEPVSRQRKRPVVNNNVIVLVSVIETSQPKQMRMRMRMTTTTAYY